MPVQWTTEVDHRLLLLILEIVQVDHKKIAERWAEKYGTSSSTFTPLHSRLAFEISRLL